GWVKYFNSRPMTFPDKNGQANRGKVKQLSITKDADKWFASFMVEFDVELPDIKDLDVGIDLGVVHAIATSDGKFFDLDVAKIKRLEAEIAKWQRKLDLNKASRKKLAELGKAQEFDKKEPSRKRRRILERIRKLNYKIRCIRQDFYKKTAHALAQEYGCVYAEELKVRNMTKSAKGTVEEPGTNVKQKSGLNRAILRTGFYGQLQAIGWAMTKTGGIVVKVDPKYTSRQCPKCGCEDKKNRPKQAVFKCCRCGHSDNADTNGAVNVRIRGRAGPIAHEKKQRARAVNGQPQGVAASGLSVNRENHP
ncbi:MAG: transposase, partial [Sutterellaceae bacterium]|nr:transposase [Sutterellaceae bacterium]